MGKAVRIKRVVLLYLVLIVLGIAAGYLLLNGKLGLRCLFSGFDRVRVPRLRQYKWYAGAAATEIFLPL